MGETMVAHQFVGSTFFAMRHSGELCGSNGLPLTPNSITILGRSQFLKMLTHPHLCSYLDVIRGKHERSIVVSEYHGCPLPRAPPSSLASTIRLAHQVVEALSYLNTHGLVHRCLCPDNILINAQGTAKLFNYGLYYMTGAGADVLFPIGGPKYTAPEVLLLRDRTPSGPKADVWSLGIILAELILGPLWPTLSLGQTLRRVLSLLHSDTSTLERLARDADRLAVLETLPEDVKDLINSCLRADPRIRPTPSQLLGHAVFTNSQLIDASPSPTPLEPREKEWGCNPLSERPLSELYHLWRLAGGDLHAELKRQGLVRTKPPVLSLPNLILLEGTSFGRSRDQATLLDLRVVPLPLDTLVQRLAHLPLSAHYPLTLAETKTVVSEPEDQSDAASLPLVIRERDTEYQFCRIVLCDRLLKGYPYQKAAILKEAHKDVPPLLRGKLWAVLLGVVGDIDGAYISIDKETVTATDRQIEVDIPRCHQYNELLSSREGHCKLKRVLKAWVVAHPRYVYWQGLDSLCAPFLYLNFNDEARAYACLAAFVPKYLHDFFLKDNSVVIKEYLLKFSQLITFHDPKLSCHLREIAFIPELFAIPWFLTMFSHVFPLHKIFHLWDKLLLGDASFPLYVGLAILRQLRDTLLASGFNECILLFSDLPEVDIERCVAECIELYCSTPRSVTHREHELKTPDRPRHDPLEINGVTVAELQAEVAPRISGSDLVELITTKFSRPKVFVVDVRNHQDYVEAAIPGSVNIPIAGVDLEADSITSAIPESPELSILFGNKGKIIVVGGDGIVDSSKMCSLLVQSGFVRVCCLHRGMSVLKSTGLLSSVLA